MKLFLASALLGASFQVSANEGFIKSQKSGIEQVEKRLASMKELKDCQSSATDIKTLKNCNKDFPQLKRDIPMSPEEFSKMKTSDVLSTENRIIELQEKKSCMSSATDWKAIHACHEKALQKIDERLKP